MAYRDLGRPWTATRRTLAVRALDRLRERVQLCERMVAWWRARARAHVAAGRAFVADVASGHARTAERQSARYELRAVRLGRRLSQLVVPTVESEAFASMFVG